MGQDSIKYTTCVRTHTHLICVCLCMEQLWKDSREAGISGTFYRETHGMGQGGGGLFTTYPFI